MMPATDHSRQSTESLLEGLCCGRGGCACQRSLSKGFGLTHCPTHDDQTPSLSVSVKNGKVLVRCQTGCTQAAVIAALRGRGLWPELGTRGGDSASPRRLLKTTTWKIRDYSTGEVVAEHRRYDHTDGSKDYAWHRAGKPGLRGLREAELPLYLGYEVLSTLEPGYPVVIAEGEKAADALMDLGIPAVASVLGAPKVHASSAYQRLAEQHPLVFWPDADDKGEELLQNTRRLLLPDITLRAIVWPGAPLTGDAADFRAAGGTAAEVQALLEGSLSTNGASLRLDAVGGSGSGVALPQTLLPRQGPLSGGEGGGEGGAVGRLNLQLPTTSTTALEVSFPQGIDAVDLRAQELLDEELPSLPLLGHEGYIIIGWSNLLAGYPRAGKTDLLCACIPAWLADGHTVLYLTEEPQTLWHMRLRRRPEWSRGCRIVPALGVHPDILLAGAVAASEDIIVVDAIRNLLAFVDENDNSEVARKINPWVVGTRQTGKTLELLHHLRKGAGEHGEGIAGGHALLGAVDIALELLHDQHGIPNRRRIRAWARLIQPAELLYEQNADKQLVALGDPAQLEQTALEQRLIDELSAEEWFTTKEVHGRLGEPKPSHEVVRRTLTHLAQASKPLVEREPPITVEAKGKTHHWALPGTPRAQLPTSSTSLPLKEPSLGS